MFGYHRTDEYISDKEIKEFKEHLREVVEYSEDYGEMAATCLDIIQQLEDEVKAK